MGEQVSERTGFLFDGMIDEIDPITARVTAFEEARQVAKLIMIASESAAPLAVRQALASVFTDLYAEGYPAAHTSREPEELIADEPYQIAYHQRYSDRRYYKGTEFADQVEALAQTRIRHLFAPNRYPHNPVQLGPDQIQANVQPLSGANANTAVYLALLQTGDTIMGLNLSHGGHLTHGSPANLSGKLFKVVAYGVNPETGRIDYDEVERLARENNPRMIVTGASAYPWGIDFARLRQICDALPRKAYLLADVSHPAGLVVSGLFPNPVGIADVTTFTTHKTLIGPRAAVILTTNEALARRIDRAVFPGLQGGPHLNTIAALAVAFKIAETPQFDELQRTIVKNAQALGETLVRRGLTLAYGGTETHLLLVDLKALPQPSGVLLNGDVAGRILDLAGIVCNKNTIADDASSVYPTGIRLGTPWITQRGLTPDDMRLLGGVIADVLKGIVTFAYFDPDESAARGKIPPAILKQAQKEVAALVAERTIGPAAPAGSVGSGTAEPVTLAGRALLSLAGRRLRAFLSQATGADVWNVDVGQAVSTTLSDALGDAIGEIALLRRAADQFGQDRFVAAVDLARQVDVVWWLEALSSGLVVFDPHDPWAKISGPVAVAALADPLSNGETDALVQAIASGAANPDVAKPYFIGQRALASRLGTVPARPEWNQSPAPVQLTSPVSASVAGERAPGGWTMPRSYGDAAAELNALRESVGLIDESGLGVLEVSGPDAGRFLDLVTTNDLAFLPVNAAQYTFVLDPHGRTLGDALLYRVERDRYLVTTAPSASSSVESWLLAAQSGATLIDLEVPTRRLPGRVSIKNLRQPTDGMGQVVLGLAGPGSLALLRGLADSPDDRRKLGRVRRFTLASLRLSGASVVFARTGHTGQAQQFEVFVPLDQADALWSAILARGADAGARAVGWDAWQAAGIAAGLPTIGQDLGGALAISPVQAGVGKVVRVYKPFFVGRSALLAEPYPPRRQVFRFHLESAGDRSPAAGDPLTDSSGVCVGYVTSPPTVDGEAIGLGYGSAEAAKFGAGLTILDGGNASSSFGEKVATDQPVARAIVLARHPK
jgi:glycine hydroxymethyltransferase